VSRPVLGCRPSPALAALVEAHRAATDAHAEARAAWKPLLDARLAGEATVTDVQRREAEMAVPIPPEVVVPVTFTGRDCFAVTYHRADGTTDRLDFPTTRALDYDELKKWFADDPAGYKVAYKAMNRWFEARLAARSGLTPSEVIELRATCARTYDADVKPKCLLAEAADDALWSYEPTSAEDRVAYVTVLLGELGAAANRQGEVRGFQEDVPIRQARRIMTLLMGAALDGARAGAPLGFSKPRPVLRGSDAASAASREGVSA
jgi:hypothetical protein